MNALRDVRWHSRPLICLMRWLPGLGNIDSLPSSMFFSMALLRGEVGQRPDDLAGCTAAALPRMGCAINSALVCCFVYHGSLEDEACLFGLLQ